jgi:hypothetical protein
MSEAGTAAAAATTAAAWHAGLSGDDLAHAQTRQWVGMTAEQAAVEAIKAHRNAEQVIGIPREQILRKPKDAGDTENWAKINEVRGVPKDPKEYDFAGLKFADGTEADPAFVEAIRTSAAKYSMSTTDAKGLATDVMKLIEQGETADSSEYQRTLDAEKEALKVNWGNANYAHNLITAQNAALKLGIDSDGLAALEKIVGYSKVMDMMLKVGKSWGEDKFITNQGPQGGQITKEQASARLVELRSDQGWLTKFHAGDTACKQEFENLTAISARS